MKKIQFMDTSFRDGFQSCLGARASRKDFLPVLEAAAEAGTTYFEIGGGARFQSLYFYCQEDAFEMMDECRKVVGPDANFQTLSRGVNVVGLSSQSSDIIDLHAKMFKKHSVTTIRNFDALNDVENLEYSGKCITNAGLKHQVVIALMSLPPGIKETYPHSPEFYIDTLKKILEAGIPYDSICFKDASGTSTPNTVYQTVKKAREILPKDTILHFHTHCTAGVAEACHIAAINAGIDIIDVAMAPVSGGTGQPDILTMSHALRGTEYTLDIDDEKILKVEEFFKEKLAAYFIPPEATQVSPVIPLSPMPGGALTANTQMMRDSNCLHLYPEVIKAMREVVERGGFATSVTPVSQFYFQQAFANVTQGAWKKMTDGYGKMILGYFGKTPSTPDPELVKIAAEQLKLEPTTKPVREINDANPKLGIKANKKILEENNLEVTDENIFISAACGDKGIAFLKGNAPLVIRTVEQEEKAQFDKYCKKHPEAIPKQEVKDTGAYTVVVNGTSYNVQVAEGSGVNIQNIQQTASLQSPAQAEVSTSSEPIKSPMPGTILKVLVDEGTSVSSGDTVLMLEAMKMEIEVKSSKDGVVNSIDVAVGDTVSADQTLLTLS